MFKHMSLYALAAIAVALPATLVRAADPSEAARANTTLQLPGSQALIELQAVAPRQARVSEAFQYEIQVTNKSDHIELRDVCIVQHTPDRFEIESTQMGKSPQKQARTEQSGGEANENQSAKGGQPTTDRWTIDRLGPGETRRIQVTASSDSEGAAHACLVLESYKPVLCIATEFVKPDLEIVKAGPETATLCETIEFAYLVTNHGSAAARPFFIEDKLPDGLETITGDKHLKFQVDGLEPGDTRKFVARLQATEPGQYSSRAIAKLQDGQQARSQKVTTTVQEAKLAVAIEGPRVEYVRRPMTYVIRVTNHGDAPARDAQLTLRYPSDTQLAHAGQVAASNKPVSEGSPQLPELETASSSPQADQGPAQSDEPRDSQPWNLGTLAPGETKQVAVTFRPLEGGHVDLDARAMFLCGRDEVTSVAAYQSNVIALPALLVTVVDNEDPVKVDDDVIYQIIVANQGDAPDTNIQLSVQLPASLKYMDGSGPTEVKADGRNIQIQPLDALEPGERAVWKLQAKATAKDEVRLAVELTSDGLTKPVTTEEPTQLFDVTSGNRRVEQ